MTIWWAQWDPANYLQEIGNLYEKETGVKVTVVQEPWGSYFNKVSAEWAARGTGFDMVVGDSQWIGQAVTDGHYVDMTQFLADNKLTDTVTEATLKYYGEYPPGSGKYYAYPTEGDANGWAYRKDIVEDPKEKEAFKAKYGYDYSIPPKDYKSSSTWRSSSTGPTPTRPCTARRSTPRRTTTPSPWASRTPSSPTAVTGTRTSRSNGVLNAPQCVEALEAYKKLYDSGPPGNTNTFFTEMNNYFIAGQATFAMNYFAFLPALANEGTDPDYFDKVGFFSNPPGPYGQQFASLGGQGTSINAYISDERKQAAFDFIKWFAQDDIQRSGPSSAATPATRRRWPPMSSSPPRPTTPPSPRPWAWSRTSTTSPSTASSCSPPRPPSATTSSVARAPPRKPSTPSPPSTTRS